MIDGVQAAVTLAESLVRLGLTTSTLGEYAPPTEALHGPADRLDDQMSGDWIAASGDLAA